MSVHPVMRQNFAGKPSPIFYNIWDPVICKENKDDAVKWFAGMCTSSARDKLCPLRNTKVYFREKFEYLEKNVLEDGIEWWWWKKSVKYDGI